MNDRTVVLAPVGNVVGAGGGGGGLVRVVVVVLAVAGGGAGWRRLEWDRRCCGGGLGSEVLTGGAPMGGGCEVGRLVAGIPELMLPR
eukprot:1797661-Alexandrium_andersonii.AAC.1